jgi:hypothetical protein
MNSIHRGDCVAMLDGSFQAFKQGHVARLLAMDRAEIGIDRDLLESCFPEGDLQLEPQLPCMKDLFNLQ